MSEFFDYAENKKGELIRVGGLVHVWDEVRRVEKIKKIGESFELALDQGKYAWIDAASPVYEPPPIPERFIRFETTHAPVYFDLEQVVAVGNTGDHCITVMLQSGQSLTLNRSFKDDIVKVMDAWTAYQNDKWKKEQKRHPST